MSDPDSGTRRSPADRQPTAVHFDASRIQRLGEPRTMVDALRQALLGEARPSAESPRSSYPTRHGELLLMPSASSRYAGVKIVGVAPGNRRVGLPTISGLYLLMDAVTLMPIATFDGAPLTALRTAAVSAVAVDCMAFGAVRSVVVFGSGPQAAAHLEVLRRLHALEEVVIVGRDATPADELARRFERLGVRAHRGTTDELPGADLVLCCTSAREPLFAADDLASGGMVVAVGSHRPDARELGDDVMAGSQVIVESRSVAEIEAGDVVQALASGRLDRDALIELSDLVRGIHSVDERRRVFKSVGMAWEDLAVAAALYEQSTAAR